MAIPNSKPSPLKIRLYTLPSILLLSTISLVLAVVYTNSLASLTDHNSASTSNNTSFGSISNHTGTRVKSFRRDEGVMVADIPYPYTPVPYGSNGIVSKNTTSTHHNSTSSTRSTLLSYSATLPILSIIHSSIELGVTAVARCVPLKTSSTRSYLLFLLTTFVASVLATAWIIADASWISCELGHGKTCPRALLQNRAHGDWQWGFEMSKARVAVGWFVVAVYLVHGGFLVIQAVREQRWSSVEGVDGEKAESGSFEKGEGRRVIRVPGVRADEA